MSDDKIIDKISKLLAQAESAEQIGNADEAAAFSAKAAQLMTQYKIEMSDVEYAAYQSIEVVEKEMVDWSLFGLKNKYKRCSWSEILISGITKLFNCRQLIIPGSNRPILVGHRSNRRTAIAVAACLLRAAPGLCSYWRKFARKELIAWGLSDYEVRTKLKGFNHSFYIGYASTIYKRCEEEVEARNRQLTGDCGERGLSIVSEADQVDQFINELDVKKGKTAVSFKANGLGLNAGSEAGDRAQIHAETHNLEK